MPFSPARVGPLHDLNRVRIVETIAETIRPVPVLAAISRTAGAIAPAAPMIVATGAQAMAAASSSQRGAAAVAPLVVNVNYVPRIEGL